MSKSSQILDSCLMEQDIYGHPIGVHYKGSGVYQTRLGAFCTFATYALLIFNFISLSLEYELGSKQEVKTTEILFDQFFS